jgi:hypothetical protein
MTQSSEDEVRALRQTVKRLSRTIWVLGAGIVWLGVAGCVRQSDLTSHWRECERVERRVCAEHGLKYPLVFEDLDRINRKWQQMQEAGERFEQTH